MQRKEIAGRRGGYWIDLLLFIIENQQRELQWSGKRKIRALYSKILNIRTKMRSSKMLQ